MIADRMLVTTCPGCDTTFKLTVAILEKAGGQVRCGRCARIFDANRSLREQAETRTERLPSAGQTASEIEYSVAMETGTGSFWFLRDEPPPADGDAAIATADPLAHPPAGFVDAAADSGEMGEAGDDAAAASDGAAVGPADPAEAAAAFVADAPLAEPGAVEASAADFTLAEPPADGLAGEKAEPQEPTPALPAAVPAPMDWLETIAPTTPRRRWPWAVGAAVLALTLAAQLLHAAREELVTRPGIGPALAAVYRAFGSELSPRIELGQYSTLDLTAVAEPVTEEHGWLIIETRVQNRGPELQPYPHIFVRLLDRWQATIAGRYFSPAEYVVTPQSDYSRMRIGSTVDAQFIIVDPGPGATGFELEFCAPAPGGFRCESE